MKVVLVYTRLYGACFLNALAVLWKNIWTLVLPMGLAVGFYLLTMMLGSMGVFGSVGTGWFGGLLLSLARAVGFSIYTYFVAGMVARERVNPGDLRTSVGAFFWTWISLFFVLWIVDLLLGAALAANPQRSAILTVLSFMELIALNATPEVIYQKQTRGGVETIIRSFKFLQENWIEWFIPNGFIIAGLYFFLGSFRFVGALGAVAMAMLAGAVFHVVMVFRGFLFEALDGSTHRQRMFRYRSSAL